jgi:hypothetical protein
MNEKTPQIKTFEEYKKLYFTSEVEEQELLDGRKVAQISLSKASQLLIRKPAK